MTTEKLKAPSWFWVFAFLLLIWNIMGILNFIGQATMTQEQMEALTENQRALMENRPSWVMIAFGVAVFGGLFGSIALVLRKKIAKVLFIFSMLGVAVQFTQSISSANDPGVFTTSVIVITGLIILLGLFAIWLSHLSIKNQWIK